MKKHLRASALILSAVLLCGCAEKTPESGSSAAASYETSDISTDMPLENSQILKLLKDYGDFTVKTYPLNKKEFSNGVVDKTNPLTVDIDSKQPVSQDGEHTVTFYKATDEWKAEFFALTTENMRKDFAEHYINNDRMFIYEDEYYLYPNGGAGDIGTGNSSLRLDSFEKPDENTVILHLISFGDKDEWGLDEDIIETDSVTIVKKDGGFLIDKCSDNAARRLAFYKDIEYRSEIYNFLPVSL